MELHFREQVGFDVLFRPLRLALDRLRVVRANDLDSVSDIGALVVGALFHRLGMPDLNSGVCFRSNRSSGLADWFFHRSG